jgi:hypothetical protein
VSDEARQVHRVSVSKAVINLNWFCYGGGEQTAKHAILKVLLAKGRRRETNDKLTKKEEIKRQTYKDGENVKNKLR